LPFLPLSLSVNKRPYFGWYRPIDVMALPSFIPMRFCVGIGSLPPLGRLPRQRTETILPPQRPFEKVGIFGRFDPFSTRKRVFVMGGMRREDLRGPWLFGTLMPGEQMTASFVSLSSGHVFFFLRLALLVRAVGFGH